MRRILDRSLRAIVLASAVSLLVVGCGADAPRRARLYRAEKALYDAKKVETQLRLSSTEPDSAKLMQARAAFLKVRAAVPGPYPLTGKGDAWQLELATIRIVGIAEVSAARMALAAGRADLALEASERLRKEASADTMTGRQAAFMAVAAYKSLRRYDEAIAEMKAILKTYPPLPPPPNGEDPVLAIPETIVTMKRNLGDEEGVKRELREALEYYQSLLAKPLDPALEAQVRARVLRSYLELDQMGRALEEANALERLVVATPSLHAMLAEVTLAKGKIRATLDKDPTEGIAMLDRVAFDFPTSPLASRALFEAATQTESHGSLQDAKTRYEALLQRFPDVPEISPIAMFRLGIVKEKMGDWEGAKRTLESLPVQYPNSPAAAEGPIAIIQHYVRDGRKTAAELYFSKALDTYRTLVQQDSTGMVAPLFRMKMYQIYSAKKDTTGIYGITDEMVRNASRHPYTAQMLLDAAKWAKASGNPSRGVAYLRRFLQDFPKSPLAGDVRREIREHPG